MSVVGGVPSARPGGLHQACDGSPRNGPLPLRLVSTTKCLPPRAAERRWPYSLVIPSVWKLETFRAKPSAFATPARPRGSTSFCGSWIQSGLPASRYTFVCGCAFSRTIASESNCSRCAWYSPGVQPSTMWATASGSRTTSAGLSPRARANRSIQSR